MLFAGDLFDAIPFSTQPTVVVEGDDDDGERKHYVGEIDWAYGLLVTPTCDMADQRTGEPAHPPPTECSFRCWRSRRCATPSARRRTNAA
jgi:hypothetical protein